MLCGFYSADTTPNYTAMSGFPVTVNGNPSSFVGSAVLKLTVSTTLTPIILSTSNAYGQIYSDTNGGVSKTTLAYATRIG